MKNLSGRLFDRNTIETQCEMQKNQAVQDCEGQVEKTGTARQVETRADRHQQQGMQQDMYGGLFSKLIIPGQHAEAAAQIVIAVHPRNGKKMRHLPNIKNQK